MTNPGPTKKEPMRYDAFISHASEDKKDFVAGLAELLTLLGANIWYDEFALEPGDSLSRSIDRGLVESRYGLVVLSKNFFAKDWPDYELRGLISQELGRDKVIIPIWHGVSRDEVLRYSPWLADKVAIKSQEYTLLEISLRILKIIRPDLLHGLQRKVIANQELADRLKEIGVDKIKGGPIRHEKLPQVLVNRIIIITHVLQEVFPEAPEQAINSFRRDTNPEREVQVWELIAACYMQALKGKPEASPHEKQEIFRYFLLRTMAPLERLDLGRVSLTTGEMDRLKKIFESLQPKILEMTEVKY